jgi:hypothetical protein
MAQIVETAAGAVEKGTVDPVTLDLIENALRNARYEMDEVLFRTALSPGIREQHDEFPLIGDPSGKMVVGQFGLSIPDFLENFDGTIEEGDVLLTSDPYACGAVISHANDWLVVMPIFHEGRVVGWASMFGHMSDVGGKTPCSMPTDARTIYEEGVVIPPFKLYARGERNDDALRIILNQVRMPDWNRADLNGLVAACRTAGRRVVEMCRRFGTGTYLAAVDALLQRNYDAMKVLLELVFEEGRTLSFTDYICDDGVGYGPYELKLSLTRTGEKVHLDFTGSSPQAAGPVNYYINESLTRMFFGIYMITVADPQILWNDGFYPLVDVTIPDGSYWKPKHPASLNGRNHGIGRVFDLFGGLLGQTNPALLNAAGFSSSPHFMYSGHYTSGDRAGEWFQLYSIGFRRDPGAAAGRRAGRALAVAELRQHPVRVPRVVLPAADREVGDRRRHRRCGPAPGRQRRRRRVRLRGARRDRDPRRPVAHLPLGRQRWHARCPGPEVDRTRCQERRGWHPPGAAEQVPRREGLPRRRAALRHLGRGWLGRPAGAGPGARRARGPARPGHRRRSAPLRRGPAGRRRRRAGHRHPAHGAARRPSGRSPRLRYGPADRRAAGPLRGGDRPARADPSDLGRAVVIAAAVVRNERHARRIGSDESAARRTAGLA